MIPQWMRDHGVSITIGAYIGYFVLGGMVHGHVEEAIFTALVIALVIGSLWAINRAEE